MVENSGPPLSVLLAAIVPLFVVVWFGSMYLIAAVGGWRELARVYRADGPPTMSREWRNRAARMRYGTGYNGCVNIAANALGIHLSLWRIFRPGHPPLFIPWSDISTEPASTFLFEGVRFSFLRANVTLMLRRPLAEEVLRVRPSS